MVVFGYSLEKAMKLPFLKVDRPLRIQDLMLDVNSLRYKKIRFLSGFPWK